MKKKLGRPKQPKGQFKGVLIGARFTPSEAQEVHQAIKESKKEKSQWIRNVMLSAANPKRNQMKIKLTVGELEELQKQDPSTARDGGFQNFLVQLGYRVSVTTGELDLDSEDLARIHRYAFDYKNGGWQNRLKKIFARTLGDDLSGLL